jgi:hypothetical protein
MKRRKKGFRKFVEILGNLEGRGEKDFAGFSCFGCQRDFRDGGDGEADWLAGPRHARDSRRGGRQQRWGGMRWQRPGCGRCRWDSRHTRRG